MLKRTFCHIPGIGAGSEQKLWDAGICSWADVCNAQKKGFSPRKSAGLQQHVEESVKKLSSGNARHFYDLLPSKEHWRLFADFADSVAYLDIETTGLTPGRDYVTTIALYDGKKIRHYVNGVNLVNFRRDIARYKLIVTYNGKTFDIPFLRRSLDVDINQAHIDMRYVLASLGYKGGLKECERQFNLDREELAGVDGFFAVLLWDDYKRNGNSKALETLLAYNITDVVNLAYLMPVAYNMKLSTMPYNSKDRVPIPKAPKLPFKPHAATIRRINASQW